MLLKTLSNEIDKVFCNGLPLSFLSDLESYSLQFFFLFSTFQFVDSKEVWYFVAKIHIYTKSQCQETIIFAAFHCYVQFASDTQGYYGLSNSVRIHKLTQIYKKKIDAINNRCKQLLSSRLISKDLSATLVQATGLSSRDKQKLHWLF